MSLFSADKGSLQLRVGLLGNPCVYPEWSEDQVRALVEIGFNAVQLNIAWGYRPNDEALNLCDVVTAPGDEEKPRVKERREDLRQRVLLAGKYGLRTLFHFGSPFMWRNPYTGQVERDYGGASFLTSPDHWFDVLNPLAVEHETALLRELRREFPDIDDILAYTYDQDAWQSSEFKQGKYARGIPLHERLPAYL